MTKEELIGAYEQWFDQLNFSLFATLTFRGFPSRRRADHIFRRWIDEMKHADGAKDFRWVRVAEYGAYGDNIHYHALIGGLRNGSKWPWMFLWDEIGGDFCISYYRSFGGAIRYMLKEARPGCDFDIEIEIPRNFSSKP